MNLVVGATACNNRRDPVRFLQFCLGKAAHLFLYGMYGLSLVRALGGSGLVGARGLGLAALLVVLVAALDEHNQARIAGRSGRPEDVALDFAGFFGFLWPYGPLGALLRGTPPKFGG